MSEVKTALPSEAGHFYDAVTGAPCYEVPYADPRKGMRATTIRDAKAMGLVPSVTLITRGAAAPGLESWKQKQLLEAALTLPRIEGESLDDFSKRVIEDSQAQALKAREAGTSLHKAIELYISGIITPEWDSHLSKLDETLTQYGINIREGKPEHCFASPLCYGGKVDFHNDEVLLDFKTTATINGKKKQLHWPEMIWQLSAYNKGLGGNDRRSINVFLGIDDSECRIHEWSREDDERGWAIFECLLRFWQLRNNYNGVTP